MSNANRIGSCAWKLFQIGTLVLILIAIALTILFKSWDVKGKSRSVGGGHKELVEALPEGDVDAEDLHVNADHLRKDMGILADGSTRVKQTVLWQIIDGQIYYRIILTPYDQQAQDLMASPLEALFISFVSKEGTLLAPKSGARRIETRSLRVAKRDGQPSAWFIDGKVPVDKADETAVDKPVVGWFFSSRLHARLRQL